MPQPDLFTFGAHGDITAARHGGNDESTAAFAKVEPHRQRQREDILALLRSVSLGLTVEEISNRLGMRMTSVSARASELKRDHLIRPSGRRRETSTGAGAAVLILY